MIYETGQCPYMRRDFGIGHVMFLPNYTDSPEDHAVSVMMEWTVDSDEEEVDQRLETWVGLPCLAWFRFHLTDLGECDVEGLPGFHMVHGFLDAETALELKANAIDNDAYTARDAHDGR